MVGRRRPFRFLVKVEADKLLLGFRERAVRDENVATVVTDAYRRISGGQTDRAQVAPVRLALALQFTVRVHGSVILGTVGLPEVLLGMVNQQYVFHAYLQFDPGLTYERRPSRQALAMSEFAGSFVKHHKPERHGDPEIADTDEPAARRRVLLIHHSMEKLVNKLTLVLGAVLITAIAGPAAAQDIDMNKKGWEVAARSDRSDRGFGDSRVALEMVLHNAAGKETRRTLEITTLELPDESIGDRSLAVFFTPGDIDGTALLSHARILEPDDQWLFLPALKRVKRISSANKSGPFVGSEFALEDISSQELGKYEYTWLRTEACGEFSCDVIERRPLYEYSGYSRQIGWVDQTHHQARKVEYYDRKGDLMKTQHLEDYRLYQGKYWRPQLLRMENHVTGKSTELVFGDYLFGVGLDEGDFVKGVLRRKS